MSATLHVGDCREVMRAMEADSFHAIATDPPYGFGFMGRDWDHGVPGVEFWREALRVAKPGAHLVAFGGPRTYHRVACAIEDAGWEIRDCLHWLFGSGFPKSHNLDGEWSGYGTAAKPAYEPIVLARKKLRGTVAANVQAHGCGALNVDGCRVGLDDGTRCRPPSKPTSGTYAQDAWTQDPDNRKPFDPAGAGRWPANLLLGCACEREHDPDCAVAMLDAQSGERSSGFMAAGTPRGSSSVCYGEMPGRASLVDTYADTGGASRFFYTAKATRAEREAGLEHRQRRRVSDGRTTVNDTAYQRDATERANTHPTVKPVSLMRWLVRLVGGKRGSRVLDPFMGSGTTGIACELEGFEFVGIDLDPEHVEIARARILAAAEVAGTATAEQAADVTDRGGPVQLGLLADPESA